MSNIKIGEQFFVERKRNNVYAWSMFGGLIGVFLLYGLFLNLAPSMLRRYKTRFPRFYQFYMKSIRFWKNLNATFRVEIKYLGTFYVQSTVFLVLAIYVVWLVMMSWCDTIDLDYEPRYYIVGKKLSKVAVGNMPLLMLFITKNDVLSWVTGWPSHHLTLLHIWMGRIIYLMIIAHVYLTLKYWIDMKFYVMVMIPPQIIGMIAFGCMTLLTLLSPGVLRRLSYEFFLFNHRFFGFFMLLAGFLHNDGAKAGILLAVHAIVLDRIVSIVKQFIFWWCLRPVKSRSTFEVLDSSTIRISIPVAHKHFEFKGKTIKTFGDWKPGQYIYLKVWTASKFEWHPYTIASLSESGELIVVMKVYKGFTKKLLKVITQECEKSGSERCELKSWFHGPYGSTLPHLANFDAAIFVAGGTGASFTFPVALDLINRMIDTKEDCRCKRIKFVWYMRSRENLKWYESSIAAFKECMDTDSIGSISLEIYVTRADVVETVRSSDDEAIIASRSNSTGLESNVSHSTATEREQTDKQEFLTIVESSSAQESLFSVETNRPNVYDLIESEITNQCRNIGHDNYKDIAVLSCGPAGLVNEVAFEAERQERKNKNLSVYQYVEKYVV